MTRRNQILNTNVLMNKNKLLVIAGMITLLSFQSCQNKSRLPENPKSGQEYKDDKGNTWSWNPLGYWMIMNSFGGSSSRYYPSTNTWTTSSGVTSSAPSYVSKDMTNNLNNRFTEKSYKSNSNRKSVSTSNKTSKPKSGGFGKVSKSSIS